MKPDPKTYFSISKKEWNGLVILVLLILAAIAAPYLYRAFHKDKVINFNDFEASARLLKQAENKAGTGTDTSRIANAKLFAFDPNHLPSAKWKQLGLSDRQIAIIQHYEAKGGKFKNKADLQKIYSITPEDYKRLEPYIALTYTKPAIIEINRADSAQLTSLKGIGPAYAMRIIRYRDKLGGFYQKEQLKEVFGIDEEHYLLIKDQLKVNSALVKKININRATFDDLRRFPYLSYKQINAIIQYRNEHGDYENLDDMKDVAILDEATLNKIKPYLVFR